MRRLLILLLVLSLLLCSCADYTHGIYEIEITEQLSYNYSVGNEWEFKYTVNGKEIYSGYRVTQPLDTITNLPINIKVTEIDTYPDSAYDNIIVSIKDGNTVTKTLTVTKNYGRFNGNTAKWKINVSVKLIRKTSL